MKILKTKLKPFRFKDNYNIDYSPYYKIVNGFYQFLDFRIKYLFMYLFGLDCGFSRCIQNKKVIYKWDNKELTSEQLEFQKRRATLNLSNTPQLGVPHECSCKKR